MKKQNRTHLFVFIFGLIFLAVISNCAKAECSTKYRVETAKHVYCTNRFINDSIFLQVEIKKNRWQYLMLEEVRDVYYAQCKSEKYLKIEGLNQDWSTCKANWN